ncbi:MAG: NAD(P)/FAD-dependent oxidoreductase, partial [Anaerolineae bacterium]|nr:NAD(P)/FAD-dependent oxidoreductase [Anaerolineae bacterium]
PGLSAQVEMVDVATPVTYERYTGNWRGSFEGWLLTPQNAQVQVPRTLPGLRNFYMAGHWTMPGGGLPTALLTGRWAVQVMCRHDGRPFTAIKG